MRSTLQAIKAHPNLRLQIIATGMHLDPSHGDGVAAITAEGWRINRIVSWAADSGRNLTQHAVETGLAMAALAKAFNSLKSDIVLIVGDRVEAFAAGSAAHLSGKLVAHVHGGDRAAGQSDDCLRHAITKLAHVHFPATKLSASRLIKMGEDPWRIHRCGAPGVDGIQSDAMPWREISRQLPQLHRRRFALVVYHPLEVAPGVEQNRMRDLLAAVLKSPIEHAVVVYPNNDPGNRGIRRSIDALSADPRLIIRKDLPRPMFLGLMRDAAVMVGNSSSGIIEAGSFKTPVIDVGHRQSGRERGANVVHVDHRHRVILDAIRALWTGQQFRRATARNAYGGHHVGHKIAESLANLQIDAKLKRKLLAY